MPLSGLHETDQGFKQRLAQEDEAPKARATSSRDMKVTLGDLKKYGYTEIGCPRCDYIKQHGSGANCGHSHSKICRDRIKQKLSGTKEGRPRLEAVDERLWKARVQPEEGPRKLETQAAEELMREGLPEHAQLRGDEDRGIRTLGMEDTHDDEESNDEDEMVDDSEPTAAEGQPVDADMGFPKSETALERLFALSAKISEEATPNR